MGRRSNYKTEDQLDFFPLVDHVTLKPKPYWIPQYFEDGRSTIAEIMSSRVVNRAPRPLDAPIRAHRNSFQTFTPPEDTKFCSACGDWVKRVDFSPDERNRDGLQSWCKVCRNRHAKKLYWHQKDSMLQ